MADSLAALRGLRTAPALEPDALAWLMAELHQKMAACSWFTVGVMAPTVLDALRTLRSLEQAFGWRTLELDPANPELVAGDGPVFLKANQSTGRFLVRLEPGLGDGVLITGHCPEDPAVEDTWGPLPLQCFG